MKLSKEVKIGLIATAIIAVFIWGYSFLKGKNILSSTNTYYAVYNDIEGLEEGSPVNLSGYKIGVVETIRFHKDYQDKIVIKFSLGKKFNFPKGSKALIYSASLIGDIAVKLELAQSDIFYADGDTVPGELEKSMISSLSDELMPVKNKIEQLVESIDEILLVFDEKQKANIQSSLNNIDQITREMSQLVDSENSKLAVILGNVESITTNLKNNNEQITTILENFANISDSIEKADIKTTIINANKTLAEFSEISKKINSGEGTVGMLINNDSLYHNLNNLAADLDSLIIDLNENPKRYVHFSLFGKKDKK
jgi:phospholipid/cholesterol/gamma-HCH transport system substrate-binding protein